MDNWQDNINFVLVAPSESGNVGSSARAIKAMGFSRMSIVEPPEFTTEVDYMSYHGLDVFINAGMHDTFKEAIADATLVIGLSRREGKDRGTMISMDEATAMIVENARSGNVSAVAFGREAKGLFNEDTEECAYLVSIPAGGYHSSLNLSHAVQVMAYELHRTAIRGSEEEPPLASLAAHGELEHLFGRVMKLLEELNYTKHGDREIGRKLRVAFKHFLLRARITGREMKMFEGVIARILDRLPSNE